MDKVMKRRLQRAKILAEDLSRRDKNNVGLKQIIKDLNVIIFES